MHEKSEWELFYQEERTMKIKCITVLWVVSLLTLLSSTAMATPVSFAINVGGFGYETGWSINQLSGGSWSYGMNTGAMSSYTTYSYNWDLAAGDYALTMTDTWGDGLDGSGGFARLIVDDKPLLDQSGNVFDYSYTLNFKVPESGPPAVPEPSTIFLLSGGLMGLVWYRRKSTQA